MAFCIYCGNKLSDNDRFCGSCGAKVAPAEPVPAPVAEEPATMIYQPAVEQSPVEPVTVDPVVEEPAAEPVPAVPAVDKTQFTLPPVEDPLAASVEDPIPQEPLYDAPITREHVRNAATPASAQPMPFGNKSARGSSASYSYATPERVNNPVKNKPVRPKRKFVAAFFSVILCILLLVAMLPTYVLVTVRNTLSSETFLAVMQRIELDQLPASILDEYDSSLRGLSVAEALCDELNDQMSHAYADWDELTPKELDQFLNETAFLPFIADHTEGILKAIIEGEDSYRVPTKEIVELLEHDIAYLADKLNLPMEDVDLEELSDDIVEEFQLDDLILPTSEDIDADARMALDIVGILLSFYAIGGACLVLLLLVLLLFVTNHRDPMYAVRDVGIVSVLGTILPLLLIFGAKGAVAFFAGKEAEMYLASVAVSCILDSTFIPAVAVFGLGIVLLIINGIVRKVQKNRAMA